MLQRAMDSYRRAMECFSAVKDTNSYKMAHTGLMFLFNKTGAQDSAWVSMNAPDANQELTYSSDSLALPTSMQGLKLDLLTSNVTSGERAVKLNILSKQYWQQQAANLRLRVWLISILAGLVIVLLALLYSRQRLRTKAKSRYIEGLESERERIAKELHDGVCNDLLALEMELGRDEGQKHISFLRTVRRDVRVLSHELMPPAFQYATIEEILLDYTSNLEMPQGVKLSFNHNEEGVWDDVAHSLSFQIYRVVQEAVSNSVKHSSASEIKVKLSRHNKQIVVVVSDNGVGFDTSRYNSGVGLRTIKDRASSVGGNIEIRSDAKGTELEFRI